jgi:hypothetical protein
MTRLGQDSRWLTHVLESGSGAAGFNGDAGASGPLCSVSRPAPAEKEGADAGVSVRELPNQGTRSARAGDLRRCRAAAAPGRGTGGGPVPSKGGVARPVYVAPGDPLQRWPAVQSSKTTCSPSRRTWVQKQGGGVRPVGRHPRRPPHHPRAGSYLCPEALASPKGGTSPKARTTPQVSAPLHVCLGASRARPPPD